MAIIFAHTRFDYGNPAGGYGSYVDYKRLIQLCGFPTCYVDEIDVDSDNTYIFSPTNGETVNGWRQGKAKIIFWNIEQYVYPPIPGVSEVWVSDLGFAQRSSLGFAQGSGYRYVPMGSHSSLSGYQRENEWIIQNTETIGKSYDVMMLAYMPPRREVIAVQLQNRGVGIAPRAWGEERHINLSKSRIMLNVHQNEGLNYVAPQRFCIAAAYKMPLITERLDNAGIFGQGHIYQCAYEHLKDFVPLKLRDTQEIVDYGWQLHNLLCVRDTFRTFVEKAL